MQCQTVEVTSSPGYQRHDKCSKEYLPVYSGEEPVYLDTSKLITRKPILDLLDCDEVFPPIFETTDGQLVQAAPTVQLVSLQLSKPEQRGYHVDELEHVEETDSLLYTHKKVQAYMELFHAKRSSKAVTYALTAQYCAIPGSCGEYQPIGLEILLVGDPRYLGALRQLSSNPLPNGKTALYTGECGCNPQKRGLMGYSPKA